MGHYTEDDLILFYYGEARRPAAVQRHLDACVDCARRYHELTAALRLLPPVEAPDRGEHYGLEVWQRLRPHLPVTAPSPAAVFWSWPRAALAATVAVLVVAAFVAGRTWPRPASPEDGVRDASPRFATTRTEVTPAAGMEIDASDRIRIAAIVDHLDQSERLLVDFVNAGGQVVDMRAAQRAAADLVDTNRLYREAALGAGDALVADVLDALERNLIEIAHGPATLPLDTFNSTRTRLDASALLFKVRVLADELHDRETSVLVARQET
jgi:hypothetical protein